MKKAAILLMIATVISKLSGLVREVVINSLYGTTITRSVYSVAVSIPATIFAIIGVAIATGYIPLYGKVEKELGEVSANKFTANIINFIMVACTIMVAVVMIFTPFVVKLFAISFQGKTLDMAVYLTRFTIMGIYFTAMVSVFTAYLNIKNKFLMPALVGIPMNICIIASIVISVKWGIIALGIGSIIAMAVQVLFLLPFIRKEGYRHTMVLDRRDEFLRKVGKLAIPVMIGVSVAQINGMVDKSVASTISETAIGALDSGVKLGGVVQGLFVMSIVTAMYPMISKMGVEKNIKGLKKSIGEAVISISLLVIPVTIAIMTFSQPVVRLLFQRNEFTASDTIVTSGVLFFYSIGMIGYALREVVSKAFYSIQDTKTPMKNAVVAIILNIALSISLSRVIGLNGIPLATSIAGIFCTITLFLSLKRKIGALGLKTTLISLVKITVSSVITGVCAKMVFSYLTPNIGEILSLILTGILGVLIYCVFIYFMKIQEVEAIINMIKKRIK